MWGASRVVVSSVHKPAISSASCPCGTPVAEGAPSQASLWAGVDCSRRLGQALLGWPWLSWLLNSLVRNPCQSGGDPCLGRQVCSHHLGSLRPSWPRLCPSAFVRFSPGCLPGHSNLVIHCAGSQSRKFLPALCWLSRLEVDGAFWPRSPTQTVRLLGLLCVRERGC